MSQVKSDQVMDPSKASPENGEKTTTALVAVDTSNLNAESLDILNQIIAAEDIDKTKDLTYLFNINQNKKTMVRIDSLSNLQDKLVGLLSNRVTERPDEMSNQEVMQALKVVQDKTVENKANYIDGGNFKTRIGNTTYLVGVFFNNAKKVTVEDRMKNLIRQEVVAGNF